MVKRIAVFLLMLLLIGVMAVGTFAHPVPDLSASGSITFKMDWNGEALNSGSLNLYKVGEVVEENGAVVFAPIEAFAAVEPDYTNVDLEFAKKLLTLAKETGLEKITAPIEDGSAVFQDVATGLYVVWQDGADTSEGFAAIRPFLISMPRFQNDEYVTEVVAEPKVGFETVPPTTTPPPPGDLPQTGQLNWPVPVLAVSGAALFILGFVLWTGRKRV